MYRLIFVILGVSLLACSSSRVVNSLLISRDLKSDNTFILNLEVVDNDGISAILVEIETLGYLEEFKSGIGKRWNFSHSFKLPSQLTNEGEIILSVIDVRGNKKVKVIPLFL